MKVLREYLLIITTTKKSLNNSEKKSIILNLKKSKIIDLKFLINFIEVFDLTLKEKEKILSLFIEITLEANQKKKVFIYNNFGGNFIIGNNKGEMSIKKK